MDISLGLTQSLGPKVPMCQKQKPRFSRKNSLKINVISCRASNALAAEIGTHSNFYEVLSLGSGDVGFDEIKKAYRRLALQWHPDLSPSSNKEESTKKFVEIQKAYETLSDPSTRSRYDRQLSLGSSFDVDMGWAPSNEAKFCKAVWENQLDGLHRRSHDRMTMKNYN